MLKMRCFPADRGERWGIITCAEVTVSAVLKKKKVDQWCPVSFSQERLVGNLWHTYGHGVVHSSCRWHRDSQVGMWGPQQEKRQHVGPPTLRQQLKPRAWWTVPGKAIESGDELWSWAWLSENENGIWGWWWWWWWLTSAPEVLSVAIRAL